MHRFSICYRFSGCLLAVLSVSCVNIHAQPLAATQTISAQPAETEIPAAQWLQPETLVQMLHSPSKEKPLIFQIGSHVLYATAHVPGSEYIGAAGTDAGLQALRDRVSALKKNQLIVIYCGCCPWNMCPNIRPAYQQLRALGFTNVKVLHLADNFRTNWENKGYPVTKGR